MLAKLRIGKKLLLVGLLLLAPLVVTTYMMVRSQLEVARVADLENDGLTYVRGARGALAPLLAARRDAAAATGATAAFDAWAATDAAVVDALGRSGRPGALAARWKTLAAAPADPAALESLIADVRGEIAAAADASGLVLDPEIESYYVMDGAVLRLPELADLASRIAAPATARGSRDELLTLATQAATVASGAVGSFNSALKNAAEPRPELAAAVTAFTDSLGEFQSAVQREIAGDPSASAAVSAGSVATLDRSFALFDVAAPQLAGLLQARADAARHLTWATLALAGGMLLLAIWVGGRVRGQLIRQVNEGLVSLKALQQGVLDQPVTVAGGDELAEMLAALEQVRLALVDRTEAEARVFRENLRVRQALDAAPAAALVAAADGQVVYANAAANLLFGALAPELRRHTPGFDPAAVIGANLSTLLGGTLADKGGNPAPHREAFGACTLEIVNTQIRSGNELVGYAVQLTDLTATLAQAERERVAVAEQLSAAEANARIRVALDKVASNVMLADTDGKIIYMNDAVRTMFHTQAREIRSQLPQFDPDRIEGQSFDYFHKNPAHQRNMLGSLNSTATAEIHLGAAWLRVVATPVITADGRRLGTVVQWIDRTQEVQVEEQVQQVVQAALEGQLDRRVPLAGKSGFFKVLAEGLNQLLENTAGVVRAIKASANEVRLGAEEIARGNQDLSQRTEEQASSLEETASSMEEMTSTVRQNADNAAQANQLAAAARKDAEKGGAVVAEAVAAMQGIAKSSHKIEDIVGLIDEIAFQTNLLALNAAVEAARAGEQGRGFAVVASEVRNLAGRSAEAAKEIKRLIQDSVSRVEEGGRLVDASGQTLEQIVGSIKKVSDIVAEIAAASAEQSSGIEQVNKAVMSMDEVTQQNAALVEEAAAAAEALMEQAANQARQMERYRTGEEAGGAARPRGAASTDAEEMPSMRKAG